MHDRKVRRADRTNEQTTGKQTCWADAELAQSPFLRMCPFFVSSHQERGNEGNGEQRGQLRELEKKWFADSKPMASFCSFMVVVAL